MHNVFCIDERKRETASGGKTRGEEEHSRTQQVSERGAGPLRTQRNKPGDRKVPGYASWELEPVYLLFSVEGRGGSIRLEDQPPQEATGHSPGTVAVAA